MDLVVEGKGEVPRNVRFTLMSLPLMMGLQEREGSIVFELPDVFWLSEFSAGFDDPYVSSEFVGLGDLLRYDRQTELRKILEAAFRRTLWGYRGGYRKFAIDLLRSLMEGGAGSIYTRGFEYRIGHNLAGPNSRPENLFRFVDVSSDCVVVASPLLRSNMVLVNRRLVDFAALSAPYLVNLRTALNSADTLTPNPPGVAAERASWLDECGIVPPGQEVEPGQVLVGVASRIEDVEMTSEERLLHALFDEPIMRDKSLVMTGQRPGRVLAEHISGDLPDKILARAGRYIDQGGKLGRPWERALVTVTVAVDQPLETGDVLLAEAGSTGVVCGVIGEVALRKIVGAPIEPDVAVAIDHPWAPRPGSPPTSTVRVRLKKSALAGQEATSRATGRYSIISGQPLSGELPEGYAQILKPAEFDWLIDHGARRLAFELYGPRSDCVEWRIELLESLVNGDRDLANLRSVPLAEWTSLHDSPSEAVRCWDRLLRSACIKPHLACHRLTLRSMTDEEVLTNSFGEVKSGKTLDFDTARPVPHGLFCQRIFGPEKDWVCACRQYRRYRGRRHDGVTCEYCGVTLANSNVRRGWMGHIELAAPIVHCWYFHGVNRSRLTELLSIDKQALQEIIYCSRYVVADSGSSPLHIGQVLDSAEWYAVHRDYPTSGVRTVVGGAAVEILLRQAVPHRGLFPDGIIIRRLPVLPPGLRPVTKLPDGRFATSDLNVLYGNVITRNRQLHRLIKNGASDDDLHGALRRLQESVDQLLDNARCQDPFRENSIFGRKFVGSERKLVSIADWLGSPTEPTGVLRHDFLHRSVDYSACTRLVPGDTANLDTAMLPVRLAWNLFQPILISNLIETGMARNFKTAREHVQRHTTKALSALESISTQSLIIVSFPSGPWRLVAMRIQLSPDLALKVHPELLDQIGWDNLGQRVNLFAVLTTEAMRDAADFLTPTCLRGVEKTNPEEEPEWMSAFDLRQDALVDEVAWSALTERHFPLSGNDHLIFCDPAWLSN